MQLERSKPFKRKGIFFWYFISLEWPAQSAALCNIFCNNFIVTFFGAGMVNND